MSQQFEGPNFLRLPAVLERVGMSRAQLYRLMRAGDFPPHVNLGLRSVAWVDRDIDAWIEARIRASREDGAA